MIRPRPFIGAALLAAVVLIVLAAPAAEARTKEQHLLDNARTSARNAATTVSVFQSVVGGADSSTASEDKGALAARLDGLDYAINVSRKNSERLSRRLAVRRVVIAKRAKRRSTAKRRAADLALAKRIGRASKASGQAGTALRAASDQTEQLAFDLRQAKPPDAVPVGVPIGQIGARVNDALALLNKVTTPPA
jgi:hypothetical protein